MLLKKLISFVDSVCLLTPRVQFYKSSKWQKMSNLDYSSSFCPYPTLGGSVPYQLLSFIQPIHLFFSLPFSSLPLISPHIHTYHSSGYMKFFPGHVHTTLTPHLFRHWRLFQTFPDVLIPYLILSRHSSSLFIAQY